MKKGMIIAGFSGVGKTELSKKYKNAIDLDSAEFVYDDSNMLHIPFEQRKGEKRTPNPDWPNNYIDAIKMAVKEYDFVLVWDREDIIEEYFKNKIEFTLCYPVKEDLPYYIERFKNRGNSEKYIQMKLNQYKDRMTTYRDLAVPRIVLSNNERLEDYLLKNNFKLILK